ncbi:MAG: hypothetical protein U0T82_13360 [Bacteroidales bacterium]
MCAIEKGKVITEYTGGFKDSSSALEMHTLVKGHLSPLGSGWMMDTTSRNNTMTGLLTGYQA